MSLLLYAQIFSLKINNKSYNNNQAIPEANKPVHLVNKGNGKCLAFNYGTGIVIQSECKSEDPSSLWNISKNVDGTYLVISQKGDWVFDNTAGLLHNGNFLLSWYRVGDAKQSWVFLPSTQDPDAYIIKNKGSSKCVDVPSGKSDVGVLIQQWDCNESNLNQLFYFKTPILYPVPASTDWVYIINKATNKCLKWGGTHLNVIEDDCGYDDNTHWKVTKHSEEGYVITSRNKRGNFVFDIFGSVLYNGGFLYTWTYFNGLNERFFIQRNPNDPEYFSLINRYTTKCVDIPNGNPAIGTKLQQWDCTYNDNQAFYFKKAPLIKIPFVGEWVQFVNKATNKCLTYNGPNAIIVQMDCNSNDSQFWKLSINSVDETYLITSKQGNYVFDNYAGGILNGNNLYAWITINGFNQRFYVQPYNLDPNFFYFENKLSFKCIEVPGANIDNGLKIDQWDCGNNDNQAFRFVPIRPNLTIRGYIKNSTDGTLVLGSNSNIVYTNKLNGQKYSARILDGGIYEINLPSGEYVRTATSTGFAESTTSFNVNSASTETNSENIIFLSPVFNGYRFILTWGATPLDLDSHLVLPDKTEIWYRNKQSGTILLDIDARKGFGPETTSLGSITKGKYVFYVLNYTKDEEFRNSKAKVQIYGNNKIIAEIDVPSSHPDKSYVWNVGVLDAATGVFTIRNRVEQTPDYSLA